MDSRQIVRLPPDVMARCQQHAKSVVAAYATGRNRGSRALSSHGAEGNVTLQAKGKMAECAVCLWAQADLETAVKWSNFSDPGFDLELSGHLFDIKHTGWNSHFLIWPINKRPIFHRVTFDILVLVKEQAPEFQIAGWIGKQQFWLNHGVAGPGHKLDAGTWHLHESKLWRSTQLGRILRAKLGRVFLEKEIAEQAEFDLAMAVETMPKEQRFHLYRLMSVDSISVGVH